MILKVAAKSIPLNVIVRSFSRVKFLKFYFSSYANCELWLPPILKISSKFPGIFSDEKFQQVWNLIVFLQLKKE